MRKGRISKSLLWIITSLFLVCLAVLFYHNYSIKYNSEKTEPSISKNDSETFLDLNIETELHRLNPNIPKKVIKTLLYIEKNDSAPPQFVGGRKFMNYEKLLPLKDGKNNKIQYREWDVNPQIKGKNRGAERLVTGSDQNAYYTKDHYKSFKKIIKYE